MEQEENLSKMEVEEVEEDPSILLAQKISSAMRQTHCVKAKAAKEENLKKLLDVGGHGRGVERGGRGGRRGGGHNAKTGAPAIQTVLWPECYKAPYYCTAKQLGTAARKLVWAQTTGGEQMGAHTLFATMPRAGDPTFDDPDSEMLDIIHDEGGGGGYGYEDVHVEDSDPTQSGNYLHQ
ncbi:Glucan endo-1,3-beta-glucosidase 5 [Hordeum vulgare]|nr:Glucan endo-1,3-beta-glucosidase 5 [Hordeum vulgare]